MSFPVDVEVSIMLAKSHPVLQTYATPLQPIDKYKVKR